MPLPNPDDHLFDPVSFTEPVSDADSEDESDASPLSDIDATTPMEEQEDGSVVVELDSDEDERESDFGENLVDIISPTTAGRIARDLLDAIERDREARKPRDELQAEGIRRTGLGNEAPGGAGFEGSSRAVHPVLIEGCIDFAARAMKELFPPSGPVKSQIIGEVTREKIERADRKSRYLNWQTMKKIREYRPVLKQTLTQVPLGGSQYIKVWWDTDKCRPCMEFVPIDKMLLPFAAADFVTSSRKTHEQDITRQEFDRRVRCGLYVDIDIANPGMSPEATASEHATAKIEGKDDLAYNEDGLRRVYEIFTTLDLEGEDSLAGDTAAPYIVSIDDSTGRLLGLYRNWDEKDEYRQELEWIVEFGFIPWRGAYKIGLTHIIGSLSGALTGSVRALLDSGHINTLPGLLKLKGARGSGRDITIDPTTVNEIEAGATDDIRKVAMALPFNPPSPVLFQLAQWLAGEAKGVVNTAEERIADSAGTAPVGTTLALIEQGSVTFSSIHADLHYSQERLLAIIHRLNGQYLDDEETVEELGELMIRRADFAGPMDIVPVSDPHIFSDTQRYAQAQEVGKLVTAYPQAFKLGPYLERTLKLLKYDGADEILALPREAKECDPITENFESSDPLNTLKAFDHQDHLDHLKTHVAFGLSPVFANNPLMGQCLPALVQHCKEHLLMLYKQHALAAVKAVKVIGGVSSSDTYEQASVLTDQTLAQELQMLMPHLQQMMQAAQQYMPHPSTDPTLQIAQMQMQAQQAQVQAQVQAQIQLEQLRLQSAQQLQAAKLNQANVEHQDEMAASRANAELAATADSLKARLEHQSAEFERQTRLLLERMKGENAEALEVVKQTLATRASQSDLLLQSILDKMALMERGNSLQTLAEEGLVPPIAEQSSVSTVPTTGDQSSVEGE